MLGGSDDLAKLIQQNRLPELLHQAQGKEALPSDLQVAVDQAQKARTSNSSAAFVPSDMSSDQYNELQQVAATMQSDKSNLPRYILHECLAVSLHGLLPAMLANAANS